MTDVLTNLRRTDILNSSELPRSTALVSLPTVEVPDIDEEFRSRRVRLIMHTDNMRILLSALASLPQFPLLRIEGRKITDQQFEELKRHRVYQFYMNGRVQRARFSNQQDVLVYLLPRDLNFDQNEAGRLLELPFSPSTLSGELGFKTFYFNARELVDRWQREGAVNDFLPQLGGVNEFKIGSDSLSQRELEEIAARIARRFQDEQTVLFNTANVNLNSLTNLTNASSYQPLIVSKFPTQNNIKFSDSLFPRIKDKVIINNKIDLFPKQPLINNEKIFTKKY